MPKITLEPATFGAAVMSIRSFIQSFRDSKRGSVAPIFALAIIPTIGLTGMAVDYSRANSVKVRMRFKTRRTNTSGR